MGYITRGIRRNQHGIGGVARGIAGRKEARGKMEIREGKRAIYHPTCIVRPEIFDS